MRHLDIEGEHIGMRRADHPAGLKRVRRLAHHGKAAIAVEPAAQHLPQGRAVIDDHHPHRTPGLLWGTVLGAAQGMTRRGRCGGILGRIVRRGHARPPGVAGASGCALYGRDLLRFP